MALLRRKPKKTAEEEEAEKRLKEQARLQKEQAKAALRLQKEQAKAEMETIKLQILAAQLSRKQQEAKARAELEKARTELQRAKAAGQRAKAEKWAARYNAWESFLRGPKAVGSKAASLIPTAPRTVVPAGEDPFFYTDDIFETGYRPKRKAATKKTTVKKKTTTKRRKTTARATPSMMHPRYPGYPPPRYY